MRKWRRYPKHEPEQGQVVEVCYVSFELDVKHRCIAEWCVVNGWIVRGVTMVDPDMNDFANDDVICWRELDEDPDMDIEADPLW